MERERLEARIRRVISQDRRRIAAGYLFGGAARGEERADSDVDVAVLLQEEPPPGLSSLCLDLAGALEADLGRAVDLVVLNSAPVDLVHRVLRDGRLILECDPSARIRFEVRARNEYFDLKPCIDEYRRGIGRTR